MGGDVTVESEPGVGSTFVATIRQVPDGGPMGCLTEDQATGTRPGPVGFTAPGFRLLVVDDNRSNLRVAEGLLAPYGMTVDTCGGGLEALALIKANRYDLVLMDHMMPGLDGVETLSLIRALGGDHARLPIVALTANAVSGMRDFFISKGFDGFLSKPIEIKKLDGLVSQWVPPERRSAPVSWCCRPDQPGEGGLPSIRGLDPRQGVAMVGGDAGAYLGVLGLFHRDAQARLAGLGLDRARMDQRGFVTDVHALKSGSANVGAMGLAEKASILEEAGRKGDYGAVALEVDGFREELGALLVAIRQALPVQTDPAGSSQIPALLRISGLDAGTGLAMSGGTEERYRKVLGLYLRDVDSRLGSLDLAGARADPKGFVTCVHAIKSASASIGAQGLSQRAGLLEAAARRGDLATIEEMVDWFRKELADLARRIGEALGGAGQEAQWNGNVDVLPEAARRELEALRVALLAEDIGAVDTILERLEGLPMSQGIGRAVAGISDLVLAAEFAKAARKAESLLAGSWGQT
jgi:CheY-like chemotaxis protein